MLGIQIAPDSWRHDLSKLSVPTLKIMIIVWAIFVIILVLYVNNPWILAGIFLYEVLP